LLTGAAGGVAHLLRPALQDRFDLVLTDRVPTEDGSAVRGDLTDTAFADDVTAGVDAIVHLAANPDPGATWEQLYRPNVQAVANLLTGAARNGVRRLVLASSAHAMGQYVAAGRQPIDPAWSPAPCCPYGASKAFVEAAARMHSYRYGVHAVCLRLGATFEKPWNTSMLGAWLAPEDLQQLVLRSLAADVAFGIYHGISANTRSVWDINNARTELGYAPVRDSEVFSGSVPVDDDGGPCPPFH